MSQPLRLARLGMGDDRQEGSTMLADARRTVSLYVDRTTQQWVVRDPEGEFWRLPSAEDGWANREPFQLDEEAELEIVPGHYRYLLNLPF